MHRRDFLKYSGASVAASGLGFPFSSTVAKACTVSGIGAVVPFELRIGPTSITLIDGERFPALAFNDRVPGPVLRVKQGRTVQLTIFNETPELHSLEITGIGKWDRPWILTGVPLAIAPVATLKAIGCSKRLEHSMTMATSLPPTRCASIPNAAFHGRTSWRWIRLQCGPCSEKR